MRKRKSIFKKYFVTTSAVTLLSILCLGVVLLLIASKDDIYNKKEDLVANYNTAAFFTRNYASAKGNNLELQMFYNQVAINCNGEIILADKTGKVVLSTFENINNTQVNTGIIEKLTHEILFLENEEQDVFLANGYTVASKILVNGEDHYLFLTVQQLPDWETFLSLLKVFGLSLIVVLLFIILITYKVTQSTVQPLIMMCECAKNYAKGDFSHTVKVTENSEIGDLETALNEMSISLENTEKMRRSFISNVSHELKTPMTSIGGFVDGILDGTIDKKEQKTYLRIVSSETKRLARLVVSMLNLSKMEAGELKLDYRQFDIGELTFKCLLTFEQKIDKKNIEIVGLDNMKHIVYADYDLIYQVVYNLIENAIKFVDEGGYISFAINTIDNMDEISVINSGPGISKADMALIFDRFYKTDESRSKDKSGVGLGLYIAKSIINMHEGKILVDSIENDYTEFKFTLPVKKL